MGKIKNWSKSEITFKPEKFHKHLKQWNHNNGFKILITQYEALPDFYIYYVKMSNKLYLINYDFPTYDKAYEFAITFMKNNIENPKLLTDEEYSKIREKILR